MKKKNTLNFSYLKVLKIGQPGAQRGAQSQKKKNSKTYFPVL